jgi:hypothetical protein
MNNPAAVALIGAGIGWRLYKHPPITTLLLGAGATMLMRSGNKQSSNRAYRDPYRQEQPRGYVPGGVAGYGYPVDEEAPGSSQGEQLANAASKIAATARDLGTQAREAAHRTTERLSEAVGRAGTQASNSYERTSERVGSAMEVARDRAGEVVDIMRSSPAVLGLVGVAAGVAIGHSLRATETGDRFVDATADVVGRSTEQLGSGLVSATRRAAELGESAASAVSSTAAGLADAVKSHAADLTWSRKDGDQHTTGTASAPRDSIRHDGGDLGKHVRRQAVELAEDYPLLLTTIGLALGIAAGTIFRRTETEDDLIGSLSDTVKKRARAVVREKYEEVLSAAEDFTEGFARTAESGTPNGRGDPAAEWQSVIGGGAAQAGRGSANRGHPLSDLRERR